MFDNIYKNCFKYLLSRATIQFVCTLIYWVSNEPSSVTVDLMSSMRLSSSSTHVVAKSNVNAGPSASFCCISKM